MRPHNLLQPISFFFTKKNLDFDNSVAVRQFRQSKMKSCMSCAVPLIETAKTSKNSSTPERQKERDKQSSARVRWWDGDEKWQYLNTGLKSAQASLNKEDAWFTCVFATSFSMLRTSRAFLSAGSSSACKPLTKSEPHKSSSVNENRRLQCKDY